ncbi:MAG TPA: GMC oxidoreductase [Leadbetterella sp.]|nr:GMC oxidoreductase [Leadbetterella sp.]
MEIIDYIVVGSGCTGAMAAETLAESGKRVLVIDVGIENENASAENTDFITKRFNDKQQSDFFLGKKLEVLSENTHPNIPQQMAQRKFMTELTDKFLAVDSKNFFPVESLALGGLGNGWGLGSCVFSANELKKVGLSTTLMNESYKTIANRIGISGEKDDDARSFCHNGLIDLQPSIKLNPAAESLYERYRKKQAYFNQKKLFVGRPAIALLTENKDDRKAYTYKDLDFYANEGSSAFRPAITIQNLLKKGKIEYQKGWLALRFWEENDYTILECLHIETNQKKLFYAAKLILSASTLSTARMVMRSFQKKDKLPVLCNAYTYMPMVYWPFVGKRNIDQFCGLVQLAMFYDKNADHADVAMASIYNYRSMLNFRILKQMPLNYADGMKFLQLLIPALFIAGIFHPAEYQAQNFIQLQKSDSPTGDTLLTNYTFEGNEANQIIETEKLYAKAFFKLNCLILSKIRTNTGASIHYSGTLPFSENEQLYHLSPAGKLYGTNNVFVADGSGFKFLPGKGLTFSLMANAHLVAQNVLKNA